MDKLLPCPFCGSPGEIVESRESWPNMPLVYYPTCTREDINHDCPAEAQPDGETNFVGCSYKTPEEAAAAWNTRHTPEWWQLVPTEATPDMMKQGFIETQYDEGRGNRMEVYRAMLAAAPKWGGK